MSNAPSSVLSGAVTSEQLRASEIGTSILSSGGNAADAIIATVLAINTLAPYHSDIGGGGFAIVRTKDGDHDVLDFRHTAPASATSEFYRDENISTSVDGAAVAVPGELRGLEELHRRYGRLPWAKLFEPSIKLAENGFEVRPDLYEFLIGDYSWTSLDPAYGSLYGHDGRPIPMGSTWRRPEYANTLRKVAEEGTGAFYGGEIAESIVNVVQERGGFMSLDDLKNYRVKWRKPLSTQYRQYTLWAPPAPASGAIWLSAMGMLSRFEAEGRGSVTDLHRLTEALRLAYGQRTALGDPAFVPGLDEAQTSWLNPSAIDERARLIDDKTTHPPDYYKPAKVEIVEDHGTSNITAADSDGLVVSITTTVGLGWGSRIIVPGYGFVLNDSMDDFSVEGRPNGTGYEPQVANFVYGGKRPLSSSCPYIIELTSTGQPILSGGAAGGSTIISANTQVARNVLDYNMTPFEALRERRLHNQILPDHSIFELPGVYSGVTVEGFEEDSETVKGLREKGHQIEWTKRNRSVPVALGIQREEPEESSNLSSANGPQSAPTWKWDPQAEPRRVDSGGSVFIA
ncbi:gamma-glutamyltransferase [Kwoniella heveanensis CBS 569]|nr:gamma-glutamyltransferase [Kwoniella heveanensis CBS 569]